MKKEDCLKERKVYLLINQGFTLIELLIVMAIIGILAGVVMVSSQGGVEKARRSSAITSLASVLPELVTCQDDGGSVAAPSSNSTGGGTICSASGHSVTWPDISKSGYVYSAAASTNTGILTYTFGATKTGQASIGCDYASNACN